MRRYETRRDATSADATRLAHATQVVPPPLPLDTATASALLSAADEAFLFVVNDDNKSSMISETDLRTEIRRIDELVRRSFERRSGTELSPLDKDVADASDYDFRCYVHFRAYNELLLRSTKTTAAAAKKKNNDNDNDKAIDFNTFRKRFERAAGDAVVETLLPNRRAGAVIVVVAKKETRRDGDDDDAERLRRRTALDAAAAAVADLSRRLRETGLAASVDASDADEDRADDWSRDLSDYQLSVALDGDATLSAQILLQEQGYRVYPDLARFGVTSLLRSELADVNQEVTSEEYYMDTNYNSDPNKFEVKEVLLNIVIESK